MTETVAMPPRGCGRRSPTRSDCDEDPPGGRWSCRHLRPHCSAAARAGIRSGSSTSASASNSRSMSARGWPCPVCGRSFTRSRRSWSSAAFEQIKLGFGHQDVGGVLVSAGASYDNVSGGRTHQSPGDVALLDTLPGWAIHVPGHADELEALLASAASGDGRDLRPRRRPDAIAPRTPWPDGGRPPRWAWHGDRGRPDARQRSRRGRQPGCHRAVRLDGPAVRRADAHGDPGIRRLS